jgi:methylase of polypeptide subunit release factors
MAACCCSLGFIQSLSRRACEQLHAQDKLRIISTDPVEDALDAVARTALRNSVDIRF